MADSKTTYVWHIDRKRGKLLDAISYAIGGFVVLPVLLIIPFFIIASLWPDIGFWLGVCALLLSLLVLLHALGTATGIFSGTRREKIEAVGHATAFAGFIPAFCFFLLSVEASPLLSGFVNSDDPALTQSFLIISDSFLKVLLFDVLEIWNLPLTGVQPDLWYAKATTTLLRFAFGLGIVGTFVQLFKSRVVSEEFFGTREECYVYCDAKMDPKGLLLSIRGQVTLREEEQTISWAELKKEFE